MHTKLLCGLGFLAVGITGLTASCTDRFVGCDKTLTCVESSLGGEGGMGGSPSPGSGGASTDPCNDSCIDDAPYCLEGTCVECTSDEHCTVGFCDPEAHVCAQCVDDAHCPATDPVCDDGVCGGCTELSDCEAIEGKPFCQESSGACVECLPGAHEPCGPGRLCHGELHECVDADEHDASSCEPCVADAHCKEGLRCVRPDRFGEDGFYCLPKPNPGCAALSPLVQRLEDVPTIDGASVTVCGHRFTSCAGLSHFSTSVTGCGSAEDATTPGEPGPGDAACGVPGTSDNTYCRLFDVDAARCTHRCQSSDDCPCGFACTGAMGSQVCSFTFQDCP